MKRLLAFSLAGALACASQAIVLDFEGFPAGTWMREQYSGLGVHITAKNLNSGHPDKAIIFDSAHPTGGDTDLETPGYHPSNTVPYGKILILAENDRDNNHDGLVDDPDDEGGRPAGWIRFAFDARFSSGYIDMIDIEEQGGTIAFKSGGDTVQTIGIPAVGDNSVQRIAWSGFEFDSMKVNLAGSAGIGAVSVVPEPSALIGLALAAGFVLRRRRS